MSVVDKSKSDTAFGFSEKMSHRVKIEVEEIEPKQKNLNSGTLLRSLSNLYFLTGNKVYEIQNGSFIEVKNENNRKFKRKGLKSGSRRMVCN